MEAQIEKLADFLDKIHPLPEDEKQKLYNLFHIRKIARDALFLRAGEVQAKIGFNLKGVFRYYYIDYAGQERTKHFCTENDWLLSLSAFADRSPALFFIQAIEESVILEAKAVDMHALIANNCYWQGVYRTLLEYNYVLKEKREADFLMNAARGRYATFLAEYPLLSGRIKQHHIASYLGISAVTLSRIRSVRVNKC